MYFIFKSTTIKWVLFVRKNISFFYEDLYSKDMISYAYVENKSFV